MNTPQDSLTAALRSVGLSEGNVPLNRDKLLEWLQEAYKGDLNELIKVLSDNPDRDKDKKAIMKKSERESSIKETTGQGLGSVIDNMPYYVDSCAWWLNGWNSSKYHAAMKRNYKSFKASYIDNTKLNRNGEVITRRRRVARKALKNKD